MALRRNSTAFFKGCHCLRVATTIASVSATEALHQNASSFGRLHTWLIAFSYILISPSAGFQLKKH
jgi:hypothetical protein